MATAVTAGLFAFGPGAATPASAATATFTCTGVSGDSAGSVAGTPKTSKELLELLASLGGAAQLSLPVEATVTAPASVATGSGAYDVSVAYSITLPDSLTKAAKDLLKVSTLKVADASFAVDVSGAASGSIVGTTPSIDVSLATAPVTVGQTITGKVTPTTSGLVYYRPGAAKLSVVVDGEVSGVKIGTLTVTCAATGLLGSTAVRPPGSPLVAPNPLVKSVAPGSATTVRLDDGVLVTPDQGNPITWSSLKLVSAAAGGTATLSDGSLIYTAPLADGSYDVTFEVCGAARTIAGSPGVDEVQTFSFADAAYRRDFPNVHPLSFTLTFDGQETAPIVTSFVDVDLFGNVTTYPYVPGDDGSRTLNILGGRFAPPSAATVQAALEALPNVGPGDIVVTGGPTAPADLTTPYTFTFGGALARRDVPQVTLGNWNTWLPNEGLAAVIDAAKSIGNVGPVPPTVQDSFNQLVAQAISVDQFWTQFWARVQYEVLQNIDVKGILDFVTGLFPRQPQLATTATGEAAIADSSTGPLCSQGVVQFVVTGATPTTAPAVQVAGTSVTAGKRAPGATPVAATPRFTG